MQELYERELKKMAPSSSTRHIRNEARTSSAAVDGSVNKFLAVKEHFDLGRGDTVEMENCRCAALRYRELRWTLGLLFVRTNGVTHAQDTHATFMCEGGVHSSSRAADRMFEEQLFSGESRFNELRVLMVSDLYREE